MTTASQSRRAAGPGHERRKPRHDRAQQAWTAAAGVAPRRSQPAIRRGGLPYLLLLPALLLELLVHLVPMVIGIVMSFKELTQFYIRNWGAAPWKGLGNYRVTVDFDAPVGEARCCTPSSSPARSAC